ncbi:hypothetical protein LX32DRAFT_656755 [Colletotrichum zoysiae]|uniref:Uncharacterized protein n=1 Tax=Colletotrichum zoysiae TaxID=1216348 RepID=A0AAD9H7N6_9PEZI|nr:hypothetical protein LX32DRAFT_656755 [Colletotrichum zoysiae]
MYQHLIRHRLPPLRHEKQAIKELERALHLVRPNGERWSDEFDRLMRPRLVNALRLREFVSEIDFLRRVHAARNPRHSERVANGPNGGFNKGANDGTNDHDDSELSTRILRSGLTRVGQLVRTYAATELAACCWATSQG